MELAPYIDRNSAHEVLYKAVSRDGAIYRGVLVRPNILVSLNDNDPDVVASTEHEALERLLWIMLNPEDETPEGFVEAKCGYDGSCIRGFFYDEYDEFDESEPAEKKFHGLLTSGSDITIDAADVWVRPWVEDGQPSEGPVLRVEHAHRWSTGEHATGLFTWDRALTRLRALTKSGSLLNPWEYEVYSVERVPQIGDVVDQEEGSKLSGDGYQLREVVTGVELVTEVPPDIQEALRWL